MKNFCCFLIILIFQCHYSQEKTTIYMIRHTEKDSIGKNPELSEIGVKHALAWANYFKDIPIEYFYTTITRRTQQTCASIAASKQKSIQFYNFPEFSLSEAVEKHKGKYILIVGHGNTIPKQINDLLGTEKYQQMKETDYYNLYKIIIVGEEIKDELIIVE